MTRISLPASSVAIAVLMPAIAAQSGRPTPVDLSGTWVLSDATTTGGGRSRASGSPSPPAQAKSSATAIGGAAFNCGRQCTIVHKATTLTIQHAILDAKGTRAATVTFSLDGRPGEVADAFNPKQKLPATANWTGKVLEIQTPPRYKQVVSLEATELAVVTTVSWDPDTRIVFKYKPK